MLSVPTSNKSRHKAVRLNSNWCFSGITINIGECPVNPITPIHFPLFVPRKCHRICPFSFPQSWITFLILNLVSWESRHLTDNSRTSNKTTLFLTKSNWMCWERRSTTSKKQTQNHIDLNWELRDERPVKDWITVLSLNASNIFLLTTYNFFSEQNPQQLWQMYSTAPRCYQHVGVHATSESTQQIRSHSCWSPSKPVKIKI